MVPPVSDRVPPAPPYSGFGPGWQALRVRGSHPLRPAFPCGFRCARFFPRGRPTTPAAPRRRRFGLAPFRSPLLGGSLLFSFPPPTWMFRFGGFASPMMVMPRLPRGGLPHSGTPGSQAARASPGNIAACRALRRLREPQASPVRPSPLARRAPHRCGLRAARARLSCVSLFSLRILRFSHPVNEPRPSLRGTSPRGLVEDVGLEPTTPGLQSRCSSQLSQSPCSV